MTNVTQNRSLLSAGEAAEILGKNIRWVRRAAASGALPVAAKLGRGSQGALVFDRAEIEEIAAALQKLKELTKGRVA